MTPWNFDSSSSGCEFRPTRGEPWSDGLENHDIPDAQRSVLREGDGVVSVDLLEEEQGQGGDASGGVFGHGAHEEDDPVTGEVLVSPRMNPVLRRAGDPSLTRCASADERVAGPEQASASR